MKSRTLRLATSVPKISNSKLGKIVDEIYKDVNNPKRVGDGSLMDAAESELTTGVKVFGKDHVTEAKDVLRHLQKIANGRATGTYGSLSAEGMQVVNDLITQLKGVLGYK